VATAAALKTSAMYITDMNGKKITITNLHNAIDQTNLLIGYFESDERFKDFEETQKGYWLDISYKLQDLAKLN
jgi:hypothetical protein